MGISLKPEGTGSLIRMLLVSALMGASAAHADVFSSSADLTRRLDNMERELARLKATPAPAPAPAGAQGGPAARDASGAPIPPERGRGRPGQPNRPGVPGSPGAPGASGPANLPPPPEAAEGAATPKEVRVIGEINGLLLVEEDGRHVAKPLPKVKK